MCLTTAANAGQYMYIFKLEITMIQTSSRMTEGWLFFFYPPISIQTRPGCEVSIDVESKEIIGFCSVSRVRTRLLAGWGEEGLEWGLGRSHTQSVLPFPCRILVFYADVYCVYKLVLFRTTAHNAHNIQ